MAAPQVSVIMSVYNGQRYLEAAIDSILCQEGVTFEFIIVNDGSTDKTTRILENYAHSDARFRLFNRENQGLTRSLIFGCEQARAEFIARQDADDRSLPGRLRTQFDVINANPGLAMVSCWARYIGPEDESLGTVIRPIDSKLATHELLHERQGPPAHGTVMFRKTAYRLAGGYREPFYFGQDSDLWLRLCATGKMAYVPEFLYEYRYSLDSISIDKRDIQKQFGVIGQKCHKSRLNGEPETPWLEEAEKLRKEIVIGTPQQSSSRKRRADASYFLGSTLLDHRNRSSKRYLFNAIKYNPFLLRAWFKLLTSVFLPMQRS